MNSDIVFYIVAMVLIVLCSGTPDLLDALIHNLMISNMLGAI